MKQNSKLTIDTGRVTEIPTFTPKEGTIAVQTPATPVHLDEISLDVHQDNVDEHCKKSDSIPTKLKTWYSHTSYRAIILSVLSMSSIILAFIGMFVDKIDACSCLGFVLSIITLFCPSPLQVR